MKASIHSRNRNTTNKMIDTVTNYIPINDSNDKHPPIHPRPIPGHSFLLEGGGGLLKPHGYLLYLRPELYLAVVKLQANLELGRAFSALLPLTEGLHYMGYLSNADYKKIKEQYSVPLVQKNKNPPTLKQLREKEELEQLENFYSRALKQWPIMKKKSKQYYLKKAAKDAKKVKTAKLVLDLAKDSEVQ